MGLTLNTLATLLWHFKWHLHFFWTGPLFELHFAVMPRYVYLDYFCTHFYRHFAAILQKLFGGKFCRQSLMEIEPKFCNKMFTTNVLEFFGEISAGNFLVKVHPLLGRSHRGETKSKNLFLWSEILLNRTHILKLHFSPWRDTCGIFYTRFLT